MWRKILSDELKLSRIVAFGCSFTFGMSLPDIHPKNMHSSKYSWPNQLAKLANCSVDNTGRLGASNKHILYNILNYEFRPGDVVVTCWTYTDRWCVVTKDRVMLVSPWYENWKAEKPDLYKRSDAFYKHIYDEHDMQLESVNNIMLADYVLETKKIKHYHVLAPKKSDLLPYPKLPHSKILNIDFSYISNTNEKALDGVHPGQISHKKVAQEIYKAMEEDLERRT